MGRWVSFMLVCWREACLMTYRWLPEGRLEREAMLKSHRQDLGGARRCLRQRVVKQQKGRDVQSEPGPSWAASFCEKHRSPHVPMLEEKERLPAPPSRTIIRSDVMSSVASLPRVWAVPLAVPPNCTPQPGGKSASCWPEPPDDTGIQITLMSSIADVGLRRAAAARL
jgi:hypothetical protein